jgi:hypothetical protein
MFQVGALAGRRMRGGISTSSLSVASGRISPTRKRPPAELWCPTRHAIIAEQLALQHDPVNSKDVDDRDAANENLAFSRRNSAKNDASAAREHFRINGRCGLRVSAAHLDPRAAGTFGRERPLSCRLERIDGHRKKSPMRRKRCGIYDWMLRCAMLRKRTSASAVVSTWSSCAPPVKRRCSRTQSSSQTALFGSTTRPDSNIGVTTSTRLSFDPFGTIPMIGMPLRVSIERGHADGLN